MMILDMIGLWDCVALGLLVAVVKSYFSARHRSNRLPYPPGPKPLPLIGNLLDIPQETPWLTYTEWANKYGEITSVTVFGKVIVFINSPQVARDLLERSGTRYLDRPIIQMMELMEAHFNLAITPYSQKWRRERKIVDHGLRPSAAAAHMDMQMIKVHNFLRSVLRKPNGAMDHLKHFTAAVVLDPVYGYDVKEEHDPFIDIAEKLLNLASESVLPGALLVNHFPALKHLPSWMPGMAFKDRALRYGKQLCVDMTDIPFNMVKDQIMKGTARQSLVYDNLQERRHDADETTIKNAAASIYAAGAETTISTLTTFFLVLIVYPKVQERAQAELDRVVGRDRLPTYADRANLPYVEAICKELLRWKQVLPLGVAHATLEDDVYNGYFIPKGTTVVPNVWAILHDPAVYPDPDEFEPGRFIYADGKSKDDSLIMTAFGFGRRMCPGRHLVDTTIWVLVVSVLSAFHVTNAKDSEGKPIPVKPDFTDTLISHPKPFQYSITPRDDNATSIIFATIPPQTE